MGRLTGLTYWVEWRVTRETLEVWISEETRHSRSNSSPRTWTRWYNVLTHPRRCTTGGNLTTTELLPKICPALNFRVSRCPGSGSFLYSLHPSTLTTNLRLRTVLVPRCRKSGAVKVRDSYHSGSNDLESKKIFLHFLHKKKKFTL